LAALQATRFTARNVKVGPLLKGFFKMVTIRPATPADLSAINEIYNYYVLHSTATYQTEPATAGERANWFAAHGEKHPVTVALLEGRIVGWGSLNKFHPREAWGRTVEDSVYVHHEFHRRGIGKTILLDLIARARHLGHHAIIGVISADQEASISLHLAAGFSEAGRLREVGNKFGRLLDVAYVELII
jgi:phosphinothricin acetyltransferase